MYITHHHPPYPDAQAQLSELSGIVRHCIGQLYFGAPTRSGQPKSCPPGTPAR